MAAMRAFWKSIILCRRPFLSPCPSVLNIMDEEELRESCELNPNE